MLRSRTDSSVSLILKNSKIIHATSRPVRKTLPFLRTFLLNEDSSSEVSFDDLLEPFRNFHVEVLEVTSISASLLASSISLIQATAPERLLDLWLTSVLRRVAGTF